MMTKFNSGSTLRLSRLEAASTGLMRRSGGQALMTMPFDALRFQYANAVVVGLLPRSILASAKSEKAIDRLEKLVLGPSARRR